MARKRRYTPVHPHTRPLGVRACPVLPLYQAVANTRALPPVNIWRDFERVRTACRLRSPDNVCFMRNDEEARIRAGGRWARWPVVLAAVCVRLLSMFAFAVGHASGGREKACVGLCSCRRNLLSASAYRLLHLHTPSSDSLGACKSKPRTQSIQMWVT
jgi:hypothetical protein